MSGDNSTTMKQARAYQRLLCAIIEKMPNPIIDGFLFEYAACDCKHALLSEGDVVFEEYKNKLFALAKLDAINYYSHRQGGRSVIVHKDSPLGRKLSKGAFSPSNEEV